MKSETRIISSEQEKEYALLAVSNLQVDSSTQVVIQNADKSGTYRQQKLWFTWCGDVAKSGLGSDDNTLAVHTKAKWMFVLLIMRRDNKHFSDLYDIFMSAVKDSPRYSEYCEGFAVQQIRTNDLSKTQRVESLTEFKKYWLDKGVNLTIPDDRDKKLLQFR